MQLIQQGSVHKFKNRHLRISWKINSICNFACSYCFDKHKKWSSFCTENAIDMLIKNIMNLEYSTYEFIILGRRTIITS